MNYEEEQGYYNVMICNKKTKVNFTIHCVDEYDRERTIKQVELFKCFGRPQRGHPGIFEYLDVAGCLY